MSRLFEAGLVVRGSACPGSRRHLADRRVVAVVGRWHMSVQREALLQREAEREVKIGSGETRVWPTARGVFERASCIRIIRHGSCCSGVKQFSATLCGLRSECFYVVVRVRTRQKSRGYPNILVNSSGKLRCPATPLWCVPRAQTIHCNRASLEAWLSLPLYMDIPACNSAQ